MPRDNSQTPLAERMRPTSLDDFVGQDHLLADGKFLANMLEADRLSSLILSAPSNCSVKWPHSSNALGPPKATQNPQAA